MKKGVVGIGDSFMWGEGLYLLSGYKNLPLKKRHSFDMNEMRDSFIQFKNKHRFINKVADYLDTWAITSKSNGGSNLGNIINKFQYEFIDTKKLLYEDIGLIIFQWTFPDRDGESVEEQLQTVKEYTKIWERYHIKYYFISWPEVFQYHPYYQENFLKNHIWITNNEGETVFGFDEWVKHEDSNLHIMNEFRDSGYQDGDIHLNFEGHDIVYKSIIKKLKDDEFTMNHHSNREFSI